MLTPTRMRKVNIFVSESDIEAVMLKLARLGVLDLDEAAEADAWADEQSSHWHKLARQYTDQQDGFADLLNRLDISREGAQLSEPIAPEQDTEALASLLKKAESPIREWHDAREELEEEREQVRLLKQQMETLTPLDTSVEVLRQLRYLHLTVGTIPQAHLDSLDVILFRIPFVIIPIGEEQERPLVIAATDKRHAPVLDWALRSLFVETVDLPDDLKGTPEEVISQLEKRHTDLEQQQQELAEEQSELTATWRDDLRRGWLRAQNNAHLTRAISQLNKHNDMYLVSGWLPAAQLDTVMTTVRDITEDRADIEVIEPIVGGPRDVPTEIKNPKYLQPFELLVSTFGLPGYGELNPTPLVALTFILMYGMMFGDVGHGLLLALIGGWLYMQKDKLAPIGIMVTVAGLSATAFGFLYGSIFGREDILHHIWLSPLEGIREILLASIVAGVVLLNIGFILNLISAWRSRDWDTLLFEKNGVAGIWLYWALLGLGLTAWLGGLMAWWLWLPLLLIPALLIFLHKPLTQVIEGGSFSVQSWGEYSVEAFFELFEAIISYVSNSLSFVRLGAFAVAHAGLSQVVFALAGLAGGSIGWWIITLIGTIIIVGFEGAIVGIQALRLEYYELFGKFFDGRGRAFAPLQLSEQA